MLLRLLACALALAGLAVASPARADFTVCNKTQHPAMVAIGYLREGTWSSAGWWRVKAQGCTLVLRGTLKSRYFYLRGIHVGVEGNWDGNRYFCVATKNFTIMGRKDCVKRGYSVAGFFEVDTGQELTWVQNLSD
jgi:uncharacterized membrane protein